MFKKSLYAMLMAMLFATPAAFANDQDKGTDNKDIEEQFDSEENMQDPSDAKKNRDKASDKAKDADNMKHPAHEMGEGDPVKEQGK